MMQPYQIEACPPSRFKEILEVWESSVRSSHTFLTEEDIAFYKPLILKEYLPAVSVYMIQREGKIVAFTGLSDELIEMLFVLPEEQGYGFGSALVNFALREKGIRKVDVNEQNPSALRFYLAKGFKVISRDERDAQGRDFPILHLAI